MYFVNEHIAIAGWLICMHGFLLVQGEILFLYARGIMPILDAICLHGIENCMKLQNLPKMMHDSIH